MIKSGRPSLFTSPDAMLVAVLQKKLAFGEITGLANEPVPSPNKVATYG